MPDLNLTDVLVWFAKTLKELMEDEPIIPKDLLEGTVNQFVKRAYHDPLPNRFKRLEIS